MFNDQRGDLLHQMLEIFSGVDITKMEKNPNFVAIVALRNMLVEHDFTRVEANEIVSHVEIKLPADMFENAEHENLVFVILQRIADLIAAQYKVIMPELDSFALFVNMIDGAELIME